ncbi:hypothetical protein K2W90_02710 [Candidatus Babeliales bacterium]|nr:hypothetical protein [Candidatus Babeliales bacterium]
MNKINEQIKQDQIADQKPQEETAKKEDFREVANVIVFLIILAIVPIALAAVPCILAIMLAMLPLIIFITVLRGLYLFFKYIWGL